jgi:hypothetical protein
MFDSTFVSWLKVPSTILFGAMVEECARRGKY